MSGRGIHNLANRRAARSRRGITLVEVIMALAIAAMISLGVASLLYGMANGTKERQELRRRNAKAEVLAHRLDMAIRSSAMLLGRDGNAMVFWVSDANGNETPNLSELLRIEWDAATKEIGGYRAPATLAPAGDIAYNVATTDFMTVTAGLAGGASFPRETWGRGVSAWESGPAASSTATRLVHYAMTLEFAGADPATVRSAVALRGVNGF
jgi:prepilin-type N-terminal cleavage/methylation domain-containing protein